MSASADGLFPRKEYVSTFVKVTAPVATGLIFVLLKQEFRRELPKSYMQSIFEWNDVDIRTWQFFTHYFFYAQLNSFTSVHLIFQYLNHLVLFELTGSR